MTPHLLDVAMCRTATITSTGGPNDSFERIYAEGARWALMCARDDEIALGLIDLGEALVVIGEDVEVMRAAGALLPSATQRPA